MKCQYKIFFSWQSDNKEARKALRKALDSAVQLLKQENISVEIIEGGGGDSFISIEDEVRMMIRRCDIFIGDVTPVGNVAFRSKLLPNANVMYEMGIATETMSADRIIAIAMAGNWKIEEMPFDFNHYSMMTFKDSSDVAFIASKIKDRIQTTDKISRRIHNRFFSWRLLNRNIASGKYLPDTFLENREVKDKARIFSSPVKMYRLLFEELSRMSFKLYNQKRAKDGVKGNFKLEIKQWDINKKTIDLPTFQAYVSELTTYLQNIIDKLQKDGNRGWITSAKLNNQLRRMEFLNKKILMITSDAGQGKTNFVCDLVHNLFNCENIPYIFVNAFELAAEHPALGLAQEYNYIGNGSLEDTILKAERFCHQNLQYLVVVIEGLNENLNQRLFRNNLARMLNAMTEHEHVKVILTCRKNFFEQNYASFCQNFGEEMKELSLNTYHRREENYSSNERNCLIERYSSHFKIKGTIHPYIKDELLQNLLLLRIFFETYEGKDVSNKDMIDRVELYQKYFNMLCEKVQNLIEQDTHVAYDGKITHDIFHKIIEWMVNNDIFVNLPYSKIMKTLSEIEHKCFEVFMNANMILQHDSVGESGDNSDVINFTFEEMRDFLLCEYLIKFIYEQDKERFFLLIEKYTSKDNNLAEGIRKFIFLCAKQKHLFPLYEEIRKCSWFLDTFKYYIWDVEDELISEEDINLIKELIVSDSLNTIRNLTFYRWNPVRHPKLNLNILFEVLEKLSEEERKKVLEIAWTKKREIDYFREVPSPREAIIKKLKKGIQSRNAESQSQEIDVLQKYIKLLAEDIKFPLAILDEADESEETENELIVRGYNFCRYLMPVHKGTRNEFLNRAGTPKNFSRKMFGEIYDSIFTEATDVEQQYREYYGKEYADFTKFLSMNYSLPAEEVRKYAETLSSGKYRLLDFSTLDYGNASLENFFMSDEMFERMYNWLNWK